MSIGPLGKRGLKVSGFVKINRKIVDWEWYRNINTKVIFLHMLFKANWKNARFMGEEIKRGSFVSSLPKLASETALTINEVRTALKHLKRTGEITVKSRTQYSIFTVNNYCLYQDIDMQDYIQNTGNSQEDNSQSTGDAHFINRRLTTIEEEKEREEGNNIIVSKDTIRPTDVKLAADRWNTLAAFGIKPIKKISPGTKRYDNLRARIKQYGIDDVISAMDNIAQSDFLQGRNKKGWTITFDWFVLPNNFIKVLEGNYDNNGKTGTSFIDNWQGGEEDDRNIAKPNEPPVNRFDCIPPKERQLLIERGIIYYDTEMLNLMDAEEEDLDILEKYHFVRR